MQVMFRTSYLYKLGSVYRLVSNQFFRVIKSIDKYVRVISRNRDIVVKEIVND